jgi:hypothetical protein
MHSAVIFSFSALMGRVSKYDFFMPLFSPTQGFGWNRDGMAMESRAKNCL